MKKPSLIIWTVLLFLLFTSFSNHADKTFSLTNEVETPKNAEGIVQFELYNKENAIPDEYFKKCYELLSTNILNGSSTITFHGIPSGKYAVNILHDENNNGIIDKGFILPKKGVGFSNYQTIDLSNKPDFATASFILNCDKAMMIRMIYL